MNKSYEIPFGEEMLHIDLPEEQILFYAVPVKPKTIQNADDVIENALDTPYGTERLE